MMSLHLIQLVHIFNAVIGVILFGLLVGVSSNIRTFINEGSVLAGFGKPQTKQTIPKTTADSPSSSQLGSFVTFAYPATFVYMLIPTIAATIYSIILACDSSPLYKAWLPSKTMRATIVFFTSAIFMAALLPVVPGADVMTDGSAMDCLWTSYMQWNVQFNNPIAFPWVTGMDTACSLFKASEALCWILFLGWGSQTVLYFKAAHLAKSFVNQ